MYKKKRVILSCERGWMGVREFSLFLAHDGVEVFVLIEGFLQKELRDMITNYSKIHNTFIPTRVYNLYIFFYLLFNLLFYRVYFFVSTTKRIKRNFVGLFRLRPFFIYEKNCSYYIEDSEGKEVKPEIILQMIYQ